MHLTTWDYAIIVGYFLLTLGVGAAFSRRAGKSISEYFVSGRSLPWWIAGTSMVATSFAADTPLAVTGMVAKNGLAGNWFWWAFAMGGMFTVFVYARLWRRAEVLTDVELVERRYGGRPAAFLRGFRAIYVALLINPIIIGWVTGAMITVIDVAVLPTEDKTVAGGWINDWTMIVICLGVVAVYSTLSGMWGVALTDFVQFCLAMVGCVALAALAVSHVGGIDALHTKVEANFPDGDQAFRFLPDFSAADPWMPLNLFLILMFVQWWAAWYPGAEPGGGGYIVQRVASCRDERHALWATLWYQIAHYCLRPWPWLLVAFAALAMYPDLRTLEDPGVGYPQVMRDLAPAGLRGLMLVTFFAAFMSTISTQMNWGASYLIGDFYRRFVRPNASEGHLLWASRAASVGVLVLGGVVAWGMREAAVSVEEAWKFLAALGAGSGAVYMLRWFWWRINAWTEISAMVASLVYFAGLQAVIHYFGLTLAQEQQLAIVAGLTIPTWLLVTWITPPEDSETLQSFYKKIHPAGPGWRPQARVLPEVRPDRHLGRSILAALLGAAVVYFMLYGVGRFIFGHYVEAGASLVGAAGCALCIHLLARRIGWKEFL